jgi:hypothetical protein
MAMAVVIDAISSIGRREGEMGETNDAKGCQHCGRTFPATRATQKFCSARCKTNACLTRKPARLRAADLEALHALLHEEVDNVQVLRERLRQIVAPDGLRIPTATEPTFSVPDLD